MKKKILSVVLVVVFALTAVMACACGPRDLYKDGSWKDTSIRTATGKNGVVASASTQASYAGYQMLLKGGNAFDAAVAIALSLGVVEPYCSGIGGGGVMTAYNAADGEFYYYNFREFAPHGYTLDWLSQNGGLESNSAGVPTEVAGLCGIEEDFGKLGLETVIQPAIDYAKNGFFVDQTLKDNLYDSLANIPEAWEIYSQDNACIFMAEAGDVIKNPNYGRVLESIRDNGKDGFYTGWVAEAIVEATDGVISLDDLAYASAHYPVHDDVVRSSYHGYEIYTVNTPSSGGIILTEALNMLEHYCSVSGKSLVEYGNNSFEYIHLVSTAAQLAYGDKRHYVADKNTNPATGEPFVNVPVSALTSKAYAADRWDSIFNTIGFNDTFRKTSGSDWGGANGVDPFDAKYNADNTPDSDIVAVQIDTNDAGTTTFSAADKDGNIVSFTKTINHFWGNYMIPAGTGFFLNGNMTSFSESSGSVQNPAPYKQPVTHLMPTIIMKDGMPFATFGTPGSIRIPCTVLQIALNVMDFGMTMQEAIDNPRFFSYAVQTADTSSMHDGYTYQNHKLLQLEKFDTDQNPITQDTIDKLENINYCVQKYSSRNLFFGGVQGIMFNYDDNGKLVSMTGGADPRRSGKALAY